MKIHEYQAKELLAAAGAPVPRGVVVSSPQEAVAAFDKLGGGPVVLKAQVHAGGRGQGRFKGYDYPGVTDPNKRWGGVKFIAKRAAGLLSTCCNSDSLCVGAADVRKESLGVD